MGATCDNDQVVVSAVGITLSQLIPMYDGRTVPQRPVAVGSSQELLVQHRATFPQMFVNLSHEAKGGTVTLMGDVMVALADAQIGVHALAGIARPIEIDHTRQIARESQG